MIPDVPSTIVAQPMTSGRIERTVEKTKTGALPPPTVDPFLLVTRGRGEPCAGCDEVIAPADELISVRPDGRTMYRFHGECYDAWATFNRE
jgi:hypothetical protein